MKILMTLLMLSTYAVAEDCPQNQQTYSCVKYLYNHDGDTITFSRPNAGGKKLKLRVQGIDTPEMVEKGKGSPCQYERGRSAKSFVESELKKAKRIDLVEITGKDVYDRVLGKVNYDGKNLNQELLQRGYALVYHKRRQRNINWCQIKGT